MGLQQCGLNINRAQKELLPHGTPEFPCAGYSALYTDKEEDIIPWHWHEELEIVYIKTGELRLQIPGRFYCLKEGDCMVINSGILHFAIANPRCELNSLVFSSKLVTGNDDSVFSRKYMLPLLACTSFIGYLPEAEVMKKMVSDFISAFEALANDFPGFEFTVREKLSSLCYSLYKQFEPEIATGDKELNLDYFRIRKMLNYIHDNFVNNITLADIAKIVDIGNRECLRCFQRTIQLSPMQYLLKYRMMEGANLLLKSPSSSISEIANLCGMDSPSNFSKMFKRFYNCSPREYRKQS